MKQIGIIGYGNLARGVERALNACPDMQLKVVFSKRSNIIIQTKNAVAESVEKLGDYKGKLDVVICCGGSATDLPKQTPDVASLFNFVDSFDNHADIPRHFDTVDKAAKANNTVGVISAGWDPGLFSIMRLYSQAFLPFGQTFTFWGKGVSQGHSDALRRIKGVAAAVQYTIPQDEAMDKVRLGKNPQFTPRQTHKRICYVVLDENLKNDSAAQENIKTQIITMPNYFADYDTAVNFIDLAEFKANHQAMPHGGHVIHTGAIGLDNEENLNTSDKKTDDRHSMEFSLKLGSNPYFTGSVLTAYARAAARLSDEKITGAKTVFDIPPVYLSPKSSLELYKEIL